MPIKTFPTLGQKAQWVRNMSAELQRRGGVGSGEGGTIWAENTGIVAHDMSLIRRYISNPIQWEQQMKQHPWQLVGPSAAVVRTSDGQQVAKIGQLRDLRTISKKQILAEAGLAKVPRIRPAPTQSRSSLVRQVGFGPGREPLAGGGAPVNPVRPPAGKPALPLPTPNPRPPDRPPVGLPPIAQPPAAPRPLVPPTRPAPVTPGGMTRPTPPGIGYLRPAPKPIVLGSVGGTYIGYGPGREPLAGGGAPVAPAAPIPMAPEPFQITVQMIIQIIREVIAEYFGTI